MYINNNILSSSVRALRTSWSVEAPEIILCFSPEFSPQLYLFHRFHKGKTNFSDFPQASNNQHTSWLATTMYFNKVNEKKKINKVNEDLTAEKEESAFFFFRKRRVP